MIHLLMSVFGASEASFKSPGNSSTHTKQLGDELVYEAIGQIQGPQEPKYVLHLNLH